MSWFGVGIVLAFVGNAVAGFPAEAACSGGSADEFIKPGETFTISGQVVDSETKKPVPNASLIIDRVLPGIERNAWPAWAGKTTHSTDADGRFKISFSAEQLAESRVALAVSVIHPDYIPLKSRQASALIDLYFARKFRDPTLFDKIELMKGVEYTAQIVTPAGKPVVGAKFELMEWGQNWNNGSEFVNDTKGETDHDGRLRRRMHKGNALVLYVTPPEHATYQHYWGVDEAGNLPEGGIPADLGRLVVSPGMRLTGRLLDKEGHPIAGQTLRLRGLYNQQERTTTTGANGAFAFAPLRQGNYVVWGAGQRQGGGVDLDEPPLTAVGSVFRPAKVYLQDGIVPQPLMLREIPTVTVTAQFVDSQGRPTRGHAVGLWGVIPGEQPAVGVAFQAQPQGARLRQPRQQMVFDGNSFAERVNGPEHEDTSGQMIQWAAQLLPDAAGRVTFRAPKGLSNAQLMTMVPNVTFAVRMRVGADQPLTLWSAAQLGELKSDRSNVTFVVLRSPRLVVDVKTEDGTQPVYDTNVTAYLNFQGGDQQFGLFKHADGRFRSQYFVPDEEYIVGGWSAGLMPNRVEHLKLREGATAEITLVLRRQPRRPEVGDVAPPFFVKAMDGQAISLDDMRGKFVLLHFWHPQWNNAAQEIRHWKAVQNRFRAGNRLAMLGFCLLKDITELNKFLEDNGMIWPQVIMRDGWMDATMQEYGANIPCTMLVGPDGRLIARDVQGDKLEETVATALGHD
jgi:peroxiredoxin